MRCRENPRRAQARRKDDLGTGGLASRPTSYKIDGWCAIGLSRKFSRLADAAFQVVGQARPTHYCSLGLTRGLTGPYLLDFTVFWGLAVCFALPERFALPVCTTVVPLLFPEAAPNAAPAAAPLATGWVFCCSSAGGGGGGCSCGGCCAVGGCWAGGGCCDEACGAIAIVTATAVATSMNVLKAIILPPNRLLCSGSQCVGGAYVSYDPSCCREIHCRDNYTYYRAA